MSKDDFVLHDWEREKMAEFEKVEARAYYKRKMQEGIEKGIEEATKNGIKQGIEKNTIDTIKNMLDNNIEIDLIEKVTNKSREEILEIKNNM